MNPSQTGSILALYIAPAAATDMVPIPQVRALPGKGLEGDRYGNTAGTFSTWPKDHELTLIDADAISELEDRLRHKLAPGATRRNIVTGGFDLEALIDQEFSVGSVRCRGTRKCPPCQHLARLLKIESLVQLMLNLGGIRAIILNEGIIRVGDRIVNSGR